MTRTTLHHLTIFFEVACPRTLGKCRKHYHINSKTNICASVPTRENLPIHYCTMVPLQTTDCDETLLCTDVSRGLIVNNTLRAAVDCAWTYV